MNSSNLSLWRRIAKTINVFGFAVAVMLALEVCAFAQAFVRSPMDKGTYPSGLERGEASINPYNGNLTWSLPLRNVGGRGDAGYTLVLPVEQRWIVRHYTSVYPCQVPGTSGMCSNEFFVPTFNFHEGQRPGFGPGVLQGHRTGGFNISNATCLVYGAGTVLPCLYQLGARVEGTRNTLTRLTFTANDESEHELVDLQTMGRPNSAQCVSQEQPGFNRGKVFVSTDGTSMTFVSDADIPDRRCSEGSTTSAEPQNRTFDVSGYLYLRDGMVYRIDNSGVSWMRDRNGNTLSFSRDTNANLPAITDSLGRQTTFSSGYAGNVFYDTINYPSFGGAPRTIKLYSTYLHDNILRADQTLKTDAELFPGIPRLPGSPPQTFDPIRTSAVELPDGRLYRFFYNSYGELARVELPTGGAVEYDYAAGVERLGFDPAADVGSGVFGVGGEFNIYRRLIEERVYPNGGSGSAYDGRTTYSRKRETYVQNSNGSMQLVSTQNADFVAVEKRDPTGILRAKTKHYYYGDPLASLFRSARRDMATGMKDENTRRKTSPQTV